MCECPLPGPSQRGGRPAAEERCGDVVMYVRAVLVKRNMGQSGGLRGEANKLAAPRGRPPLACMSPTVWQPTDRQAGPNGGSQRRQQPRQGLVLAAVRGKKATHNADRGASLRVWGTRWCSVVSGGADRRGRGRTAGRRAATPKGGAACPNCAVNRRWGGHPTARALPGLALLEQAITRHPAMRCQRLYVFPTGRRQQGCGVAARVVPTGQPSKGV